MLATITHVRRPLVAGYYYPKEADALRAELEMLTLAGSGHRTQDSGLKATRFPLRPAPCALSPSSLSYRGAIVPHGSYAFSGAIAGAVYRRLRIPARCIVLAPNHTGAGARWSVMAQGAYATPLGELPIDEALAEQLCRAMPFLEADDVAQRAEHAIEVQAPFLQWCGPMALSFVPIVINSEQPEQWRVCAEALADVLAQADDVLVLASSDLSHYARQETALEQDRRLLQAIARLDAEALIEQVRAHAIAMCGLAPVACLLMALRQHGAREAEVVQYGTSAEAGGDPYSVTGYAGVVIS